MMAELRDRFRALDRVTVPDLWTEIERLADTPAAPHGRVTGRPVWRGAASDFGTTPSWWPRLVLAAVLAALALTLLAIIIGRPPQPLPQTPAAPLIFQGYWDGPGGVYAVSPDGGEPKLIFEAFGQRIHLSPDGRHAFFGTPEGGVVIARTDESRSRVIPDSGQAEVGREFETVWAPDSHAVAWLSWRDSNPTLMVAVVEGDDGGAVGEPLEIALPAGSDPHLVWSPDSIHVGVVEWGDCESADSKKLYVVDTTSGATIEIGDQLDAPAIPAFSHDGQRIAVRVATGAVVPAETPDPNTIICAIRHGPPGIVVGDVATGSIRVAVEAVPGYNLAWSADDAAILWMASDGSLGLSIWGAAAGGGEPYEIADLDAFDAVWSPGVTQLAFYRPDPKIEGELSLWVTDVDDPSPRLVATDVASSGSVIWPKWSPDGEWIAFTRGPFDLEFGRGGSIWIVHPDGTGERELVDESFNLDLGDVDW